MKMIGKYRNGNYNVNIFEDGTKIRFNDEDYFNPEYPESMDIKITNQCDRNCPFCHEDSKPDGSHGSILNAKFIESLHPYTELAIGGGNPLSHPKLIQFLQKCKDLNLIPSMTVNQFHFMEYFETIKYLCDNTLIYGLGVSLTIIDDKFIDRVSQIPNAVIHVIAGNFNMRELRRLANRNLKILILGYKHFRRGNQYFNQNSSIIEKRIEALIKELPNILKWFKVVSFDNLAIDQLSVQSVMSEDEWDRFYMGDDGQFTMYVDMVNEEFARSSTSMRRYPMMDDIKSMFDIIKNEKASKDPV